MLPTTSPYQVASLEDYIRSTFQYDTTKRIFGGGHDQKPRLCRNRMNRILLYIGSFNPPHVAHLALLSHTFNNCDQDFNLIAAIVCLHDDDYIAAKVSDQRDPLVLTKRQRAQLWEGGIGPESDWCHVSDMPFRYLKDELTKSAKKGGFQLEFVTLEGPDHVRTDGRIPSHCPHAITSDISRPLDFIISKPTVLKTLGRGNSTPLSLQTLCFHEGWEKVQVDETREVWVCICKNKTKRTVRFVPAPKDSRLDPEISSTKIRDIIASCHNNELERKLQNIALRPDLLVSFLDDSYCPDLIAASSSK
ncbi:hypothetical protein B0O99DRAFT_639928 [Bisporella sp. PMI_857]|nr:hypothetical protein B0O99DRAFT_639928 [Bisporella sp. PMI_857]